MTPPKLAKARGGKKGKPARAIRQKFPPGWNEAKVRQVIDHYDNLTDEELAAEIEAAEPAGWTLMSVPSELVPAVRKLIARHQNQKTA